MILSPDTTTENPVVNVCYISLTNLKNLREGSRSHFDLKIPISTEVADKLKDSSIKVMVYCTSDLVGAAATFPLPKADVSFPRQIEMKINGLEVNADLKGIDKKTGSTKPADITSLIVKRPDYPGNFMNISYPPNSKTSDQRVGNFFSFHSSPCKQGLPIALCVLFIKANQGQEILLCCKSCQAILVRIPCA